MNDLIKRSLALTAVFIVLSAFTINSEKPEVQKETVAVILPLTGKHKPFGTKMLKGIQLAANIFSEEGSQGIEYLIRDYESDDSKLNEIIAEMDRRNVLAIIGPTGTQACRQANLKGIPTFVFSQESLASKDGSCCFGNFLTIENQARILLRSARDSGIRNFAVLSPANQFGVMYKNAFIKSAPEYGIEVIAAKEYPDNPKEFPGIIRSFKDSLKTAPARSQKSMIRVDALLIPDSARNASILAAYLSNYGLQDIGLYGPTLWDSPELIRLGGKNIEGAYFLSGFYSESLSYQVRDFVTSFNNTFYSPPSIWEASAYDATRIIRELIRKGNDTRDKLKLAISSIKDYQGATGVISFDVQGSTNKEISVLRVIDGTVIEVIK